MGPTRSQLTTTSADQVSSRVERKGMASLQARLWIAGLGALLSSSACGEAPSYEYGSCFKDGQSYAPGDEVPSGDCNTCSCGEDGQISCTLIGCVTSSGGGPATGGGPQGSGATGSGGWDGHSGGAIGVGGSPAAGGAGGGASCEWADEIYAHGEAVPSGDCNSCGCDDGAVWCTLIHCGPPLQCQAPFEIGDCDAAIPVYYHNPTTGTCEPATYGGCGGNDNRFATFEECQMACGASDSRGISCEVNGVTYPDGSTNVPDPTSCNTCSCDDGQITSCTDIACPTACAEGTILSTECAQCGPTDACQSVRTACLPTCVEQANCAESSGVCIDGACRDLCG